MEKNDARGRSCPEPVILTQRQFRSTDKFEVLVDNACAVQNITRFAENKGASVTVTETGEDEYTILVQKK